MAFRWAVVAASFGVSAALSAAVLFPEPLHIVREIEDPISGVKTTIHEYCRGDRIVAVSGARTVIADYARHEITEIDRNQATFSVTSFADIARAQPPDGAEASGKATAEPRALGVKQSVDGRALESFEFSTSDGGHRVVVTVAVDRGTLLSPAGAEALIGAAFPNRRSFAHEAMLRAASPSLPGRRVQTTSAAEVALPSEHTILYEVAGQTLTFRSAIVRIDRLAMPEHEATIPPGSRRVESRLTAVPRAIHALDGLPRPDRR